MLWHVDEDSVLRITFDRKGDKVNLLNADILQELDHLLQDVAGRTDLKGLVFQSSKPGMFLAGMDIEQIASVNDSARAADGARQGQAVFQRVADLSLPTAAAIGGTCLGGGTELALACDFRIAADDDKVRMGLPEVQLGIIPGFGGSQRLPPLVGMPAALDLILTGRMIDARRAKRIGLVDRVVPAAYLEREAVKLVLEASERGVDSTTRAIRPSRFKETLMARVGPLRRYVLDRARRAAEGKASPEHYPAPFRALEAVEAAVTRPLPEGLDVEARIVGELIPSRTSKNLMWLFKTNTDLKSDTVREGEVPPRKVRRAGVLGAGIMGGGIAQLVAEKGIPVRMKDIRYDSILTALQTAQGLWEKRVRRRKITRREADRRMALIAPTLDDTGFAHADLVIEAVVENLEVKQQVLAAIEQRIGERTIFATNTSSLPITDIAARALHPERVVGMHFFNPVHRMPLVEVIRGRQTSPEAVATVRSLAIRLGKTPVVVKDGPGFLVNRILSFQMNEALRLLAEGVRIEVADPAMKAFGMPMGPFRLLDEIGLDTARHVGEVMTAALGRRAEADGRILDALVAADRLGKKNGKGFYRHGKGDEPQLDPSVYKLIGEPTPRDLPPETIQERLVFAMVNEGANCLEEGVVREPRDVDMGMVMGTGFPPFRGGLLRHADRVGIPIVVDRLSRLADAHGERFRPSELLQSMVRNQQRFYPVG